MKRLRAELAAVSADRERMHARIVTIADDRWSTPSTHGQSWGWKAAFASAGIVAAGLALILAVQEPVIQSRIIEVPVERTVVVEATPSPEVAPLVELPEIAEVVVPVDTPRIGRPPHRDQNNMDTRMNNMEPDLFGDLDCPDDDPTCGI